MHQTMGTAPESREPKAKPKQLPQCIFATTGFTKRVKVLLHCVTKLLLHCVTKLLLHCVTLHDKSKLMYYKVLAGTRGTSTVKGENKARQ